MLAMQRVKEQEVRSDEEYRFGITADAVDINIDYLYLRSPIKVSYKGASYKLDATYRKENATKRSYS